MNSELRLFKKEDLEGLFGLFQDIKGKDKATSFSSQWKWKYLDSPFLNNNGWPLGIVSVEEGKIVGFMGTLPVKLKVFDKTIKGVWPADMMVGPDTKGNIWGVKMARKLCSLTECCIGTPNKNSFPISKRIGYTLVTKIPTYINLLKPSHFVNKAIKAPFKILDVLLKIAFKLTKPRAKNIEVEKYTSFGNWADKLFQKVCGQFNIISTRNKELLNWRFFKSPNKYHLFISKRQGVVSGYVVVRIKDEKIKKGIIVDFLASKNDSQTIKALLGKALDFFLSKDVDAVSCIMLPFRKLEKSLRRFGFLFQKKAQRLIVYSPKHINKLKNKNDWYLTQLDSDLDM